MATPIHGYNARIQIDAAIITNANAWDLTLGGNTVEATQFVDTHVRNLAGQKADSGSITAWQPIDAKVLQDQRMTEGRLWIYPTSGTLTSYWYGVVLFTEFGSSGSTTSAVGATLNFINGSAGTGMAAYGFA